MLSASRLSLRRVLARKKPQTTVSYEAIRSKSSSLKEYNEKIDDEQCDNSACHKYVSSFDENGNSTEQEIIHFPSEHKDIPTPVMLNAKEHAIGYLSKILNARVYEAAIETDLQHAKNLSAVSLLPRTRFDTVNNVQRRFLVRSRALFLTIFFLVLALESVAPQKHCLTQARRHSTRLFV